MISSTEWLLTIGGLAAVIIFDLALAIAHRNKETSTKEALGWTLF
jgi:tellurite resistance protein TerC